MNSPPPPSSHRHPRLESDYRLHELKYRRNRLLSHPALTSAPPLGETRQAFPTSHDINAAVIDPTSSTDVLATTLALTPASSLPSSNARFSAFYRNLMHAEGFDSVNNTPDILRRHILNARRVASPPSLSHPSFLCVLSTPSTPDVVGDKRLVKRVAQSPLIPPPPTPSAARAHKLLSQRRQQAAAAAATTREKAALKTPANRNDAQENSAANENSTPVSSGAAVRAPSPPSPPSTRCTRSATLRARQRGDPPRPSLPPPPPTCCFCPTTSPTNTKPTPPSTRSDSVGDATVTDPSPAVAQQAAAKRSELVGPFANMRSPGAHGLYVHFECACWAPQVFADPETNRLRRVYEEYLRGRQLRCSHCQSRGATVGCYVHRCKKVFHFRCLQPAGAHRVDRFFVAFCDKHAHLATKPSYGILMEAGTIADVAAAHRNKDVADGLDAPHSRYTRLRRRETEVMFSRRWRVTTVASAFDCNVVIFSHRRLVILHKNDPFLIGDGLRALRTSALDVASGKLAHMALVGHDGIKPSEMSAVQTRAMLASRDTTGIFLLRNLRGAPTWQRNMLSVVKTSSHWGKGASKGSGDVRTGPLFGEKYNGEGEPVLLVTPPSDGSKKKRGKTQKRRRGKARQVRCRGAGESGLEGTKDGARTTGKGASVVLEKEGEMESVQLPTFKKLKRTAKEGGGTSSGQEVENRGAASFNTAPAPAKDESPAREQVLSRVGLSSGKVMSAWQTFLAEHLPRERLLRPEDTFDNAMRNTARLWSLMTIGERGYYEEKARMAASVSPHDSEEGGSSNGEGEDVGGGNCAINALLAGRRRGGNESGLTSLEVGLFASGKLSSRPVGTSGGGTTKGGGSIKTDKRRGSVSLPRKRRQSWGTAKNGEDKKKLTWNEMFPVPPLDEVDALEEHSKTGDISEEPVRDPPPRRSRPS